jgi:outer membrane protein assembly factor BamB
VAGAADLPHTGPALPGRVQGLLGWALAGAILVGFPASAAAQLPGLDLPPLPGQGGGGGGSRPTSPGPGPAPTALAGSVTERVDPAHTGYIGDPNLVPPLERAWVRHLGFDVRAAVYGAGRIYVLAGRTLFALDPRTGRTYWKVSTATVSPALAYDQGRVITGEDDSAVHARSAATGAPLWATRIDEPYSIDATPVATGGSVYVGVNEGLVSLDGATGSVNWRSSGNGTSNVPAVDGSRAYVSFACGWTFAWARSTGDRLWNTTAGCSGGGGSTPVVHRGRLYVPETHTSLDAATGTGPRGYAGDATPAFAGDIGVFGTATSLSATQLSSGRRLWSVRVADTDSNRGRSPVIVGSTVYTGSGGRLVGYSLRTGQRVVSLKVPDPGVSDRQFAVAPGTLLVPYSDTLRAYRSVFRPGPRKIEIGATKFDVLYGQRTYLGGVLGTALRGPRAKVALQYDEQPFRRFRTADRGSSGDDGYFEYRLRPSRNVRLRIASGGVRSNVIRIYVYPRIRYRFGRHGRNGNRIATTVRIRGPKNIRLGRRRAVLYLGQPGRRRYVRLDTTRLRRAGRGRAKGRFAFHALRHPGRKAFIVACIPHLSHLGLGRADALDRRCGRRRIPLR